jgi:hypothetical protein
MAAAVLAETVTVRLTRRSHNAVHSVNIPLASVTLGPSHLDNRNTCRLLDPTASDAQPRQPPVSPYRLPLTTNFLIQNILRSHKWPADCVDNLGL